MHRPIADLFARVYDLLRPSRGVWERQARHREALTKKRFYSRALSFAKKIIRENAQKEAKPRRRAQKQARRRSREAARMNYGGG